MSPFGIKRTNRIVLQKIIKKWDTINEDWFVFFTTILQHNRRTTSSSGDA